MELKNYETVFILTPVLSDDQVKDTVDKFKKILKDADAEIVSEEKWGLRKLAYPIQHKKTGFYNLVEFKAPPSSIIKIETELKRDETVMRFLTIALEKYELAYAEKRRKGFPSKKRKAEDAKK